MADLWLPLEDRLAQWDHAAQQLRVTGWTAGPAGLSVVQLAEGLVVAVDHASPRTLAEVSIDLLDGYLDRDRHQLLAHLVGEEAADRVATLPNDPNTGSRPLRLPSGDQGRYGFAGQLDARLFTRFALGVDLGEDIARSEAGRGVALLEAADAALQLVPALAAGLASRTLDLLESTFVPDAKIAFAAAGLATSLANSLGGSPGGALIAARLRRLADDLRQSSQHGGGTTSAVALSATAAPAAAGRVFPSAAKSEAGPAELPMMAESVSAIEVDGDRRGWAGIDSGNNIEVVAGPDATDSWVRVFRRCDALLLGLAPFRGAGPDGRLRSTIVIPPHPADELVVDIVDDPAAERHSPKHITLREAVRAGRRAAASSRRGDRDAMAEWFECSLLWRDLGDDQRAELAGREGSRVDVSRRRRPVGSFDDVEPVPPLLADELS